MQVVTPQLISGKKVLLRLDIDVPIENGKVVDDFRLKAGLSTLQLCLEHAESTIIMGHIGRPNGKEVPELSVAPIVDWLEEALEGFEFEEEKLHVLENLRFESGEEECSLEFSKQLAVLGDFYINEAFASYHKASSTTVLPTLLPRAAGLHFAKEVEKLTKVKNNPQKPLVVIIGGAKIEDKLPVVKEMAKIADAVLVGGKLPQEIKDQNMILPGNVFVGKLNLEGTDIASETAESWENLIKNARMVVWNGPLGEIRNTKYEIRNPEDIGSAMGTYEVAKMISGSSAESIIGGGDTVGFLGGLGLLEGFSFVSTGGGAMLKFLEEGTLPTIEALNNDENKTTS